MKIRSLIKILIPLYFLNKYRKYKVLREHKLKMKHSRFSDMNRVQTFNYIYSNNVWSSKESISGPGSEISSVKVLIENLNKLISDYKIKSILDVPCGDFNWMKHVNLSKLDYIGGDIVEDLISTNIKRYADFKNCSFKTIDIVNDKLPKSDIVIVRDCFVHLSNKEIKKAIENIKSSGSNFLLTTTYVDHFNNFDIITGEWRELNMQEKPFLFPEPILLINEDCKECKGLLEDKSLGMWEISKL